MSKFYACAASMMTNMQRSEHLPILCAVPWSVRSPAFWPLRRLLKKWRVVILRNLTRKLGCGGKTVSPGRVLFVRSSTTSSSRRQCDGGGRSGLFSLCNSSYSLWCPLWPLASGLWPLASGQRRLISGTCSYYWRRRIQYTSRLVFAFFDSIIGGVFLSI